MPWSGAGEAPPRGPIDPTAMVPVTAEDAARRKRRIVSAWVTAAVVVALAAVWIHKRSTDPLKAQEAFEAGQQLMTVARYNQAILTFDRAIALESDFAEAWVMRGRAHMALYETGAAINDFSRAIRLRPRDPGALLERGQAYLSQKDWRAAMADGTAAAAINPNLAAAYNLRGTAVRETGDPQKALEDFNRAVQLEPNADNYYQRGATYQLLGQNALAIADFTQTIAFQPSLAQGYYARALAERAAGDEGSAEKDHERGRILDGGSPDIPLQPKY